MMSVNPTNELVDYSNMKKKLLDVNRRSNIDKKYALHHIGHKRWDIISKNIGENTELWNYLFQYGKGIMDNKLETTINCCGEEIYLSIRDKLININLIINNDKPKINSNTKKITNKADKIKQANLSKKIIKEIEQIINNVTSDPIISKREIIFIGKYAEIIVIKMIIQCKNLVKFFLDCKDKYLKAKSSKYTSINDLEKLSNNLQKYEDLITEMIIGFNKIIVEYKIIENFSKTCLNDLEKWINYAKNEIQFNPKDVIIKNLI